MIELRGISILYSATGNKVSLVTRTEAGDDYRTLDYPVGLKITRGAIMKFLSKETGEKIKDISIAPHVKIPG